MKGGFGQVATKQTVRVEQLRPALIAALERLVKKEEAQRGFVVVDHEPSGRYLQFCTELETGTLLFDTGGRTGVVRLPPFVMEPMPSVSHGVLAAETLIRGYDGWALSAEDELTIKEDDSESRRRRLVRKTLEWFDNLFLPDPAGAA